MDPNGNIYDVELMRRKLLGDPETEAADSEENLERGIAEAAFKQDQARLDGYLKGLSESQQKEAEIRFRERLREPFKKGG